MRKLIVAFAILGGLYSSHQVAYAEPTPQVCNYDRPCIWTGTAVSQNSTDQLYVSVYYSQDGKRILVEFTDENGKQQVCFCYRTQEQYKWYFNFNGKKFIIKGDSLREIELR